MRMHFINETEVNPPRKLAFDNTTEAAAIQEKLYESYFFIGNVINELIENNYNYLVAQIDGETDSLTIADLGQAEDVLIFLRNNFNHLWGKA